MNSTQGFILGIGATVVGGVLWKSLDARISRLEREPRGRRDIGHVPHLPDVREMQREYARMLAEDLRDQGLVISEGS